MRPVELDRNPLMQALVRVTSNRRAHDAIDLLSQRFGGVEVQAGVYSQKPIVFAINEGLRKARLTDTEIRHLWREMGGRRFYIPSRPYGH